MLAIVLGSAGLRQIRDSRGYQGGRAIAIAGVIVGIVGLASLAILVGFILSSADNTPQIPGPGP